MPPVNYKSNGIIEKLKELDFYQIVENGCFINKENGTICFKSYDEIDRVHYTLAKGEERIKVRSVEELLINYNNLRNGKV